MDDQLINLSRLVIQRHVIDKQIAALIGRSAEKGHIGEFIAAKTFQIALHRSASNRGKDGDFVSGPLAGRSVNVKFLIGDSLLDLTPDADFDYYLVLKGPAREAKASRAPRSLAIEAVYLFDAAETEQELRARQRKVGTASSITREQWQRAMIYPDSNNRVLTVTPTQREMLKFFSPEAFSVAD